jgi:hypothetical protein
MEAIYTIFLVPVLAVLLALLLRGHGESFRDLFVVLASMIGVLWISGVSLFFILVDPCRPQNARSTRITSGHQAATPEWSSRARRQLARIG